MRLPLALFPLVPLTTAWSCFNGPGGGFSYYDAYDACNYLSNSPITQWAFEERHARVNNAGVSLTFSQSCEGGNGVTFYNVRDHCFHLLIDLCVAEGAAPNGWFSSGISDTMDKGNGGSNCAHGSIQIKEAKF